MQRWKVVRIILMQKTRVRIGGAFVHFPAFLFFRSMAIFLDLGTIFDLAV